MNTPILKNAMVCLAIFHLIAQVVWWLPHRLTEYIDSGDIHYYFDGAKAIATGQPLYHVMTGYTPASGPHSYVYWPQAAVILAPLAHLSLWRFSQVWYLLMLVSFWVFAGSLAVISTEHLHWRSWLIWGLIIGCVPSTYAMMDLGNMDVCLWALCGVAFASRRTGAVLAAVAQIKTYAIPATILYLWDNREQWRSMCLVVIAGFALSLFGGVSWPLQWLRSVEPVAQQGVFAAGNWSLSMGILRMIEVFGWHYNGGPLPHFAQLVLASSSIVLEIVAIALCYRIKGPYRYPLLLIGAALAQPLCWCFYLMPIFIVVAMLIKDRGLSLA